MRLQLDKFGLLNRQFLLLQLNRLLLLAELLLFPFNFSAQLDVSEAKNLRVGICIFKVCLLICFIVVIRVFDVKKLTSGHRDVLSSPARLLLFWLGGLQCLTTFIPISSCSVIPCSQRLLLGQWFLDAARSDCWLHWGRSPSSSSVSRTMQAWNPLLPRDCCSCGLGRLHDPTDRPGNRSSREGPCAPANVAETLPGENKPPAAAPPVSVGKNPRPGRWRPLVELPQLALKLAVAGFCIFSQVSLRARILSTFFALCRTWHLEYSADKVEGVHVHLPVTGKPQLRLPVTSSRPPSVSEAETTDRQVVTPGRDNTPTEAK